jgi:hypothetical protein
MKTDVQQLKANAQATDATLQNHDQLLLTNAQNHDQLLLTNA